MSESKKLCAHKRVIRISTWHAYCYDCENIRVPTALARPEISTPIEYESVALSLDLKIDIFESRQRGWFFAPIANIMDYRQAIIWENFGPSRKQAPPSSDDIVTQPSSGFIVLTSLLPYFEAMENFRKGRLLPKKYGESGRRFRASAQRVFHGTSDLTAKVSLLQAARNNMMHNGMTYIPIGVSDSDTATEPFVYTPREPLRMIVNTRPFSDRIIADFDAYVSDLRKANSYLRKPFEAMWDYYWKVS